MSDLARILTTSISPQSRLVFLALIAKRRILDISSDVSSNWVASYSAVHPMLLSVSAVWPTIKPAAGGHVKTRRDLSSALPPAQLMVVKSGRTVLHCSATGTDRIVFFNPFKNTSRRSSASLSFLLSTLISESTYLLVWYSTDMVLAMVIIYSILDRHHGVTVEAMQRCCSTYSATKGVVIRRTILVVVKNNTASAGKFFLLTHGLDANGLRKCTEGWEWEKRRIHRSDSCSDAWPRMSVNGRSLAAAATVAYLVISLTTCGAVLKEVAERLAPTPGSKHLAANTLNFKRILDPHLRKNCKGDTRP